jgi:hypothetical protein
MSRFRKALGDLRIGRTGTTERPYLAKDLFNANERKRVENHPRPPGNVQLNRLFISLCFWRKDRFLLRYLGEVKSPFASKVQLPGCWTDGDL